MSRDPKPPRQLTAQNLPAYRDAVQRARGHKGSARQTFAALRPVLIQSRPLLQVLKHPHLRDGKGKPIEVPIFGAPTLRNVIEDGEHR
jgi:hypothetical protein